VRKGVLTDKEVLHEVKAVRRELEGKQRERGSGWATELASNRAARSPRSSSRAPPPPNGGSNHRVSGGHHLKKATTRYLSTSDLTLLVLIR